MSCLLLTANCVLLSQLTVEQPQRTTENKTIRETRALRGNPKQVQK
jgi:hypothetical protein